MIGSSFPLYIMEKLQRITVTEVISVFTETYNSKKTMLTGVIKQFKIQGG